MNSYFLPDTWIIGFTFTYEFVVSSRAVLVAALLLLFEGLVPPF